MKLVSKKVGNRTTYRLVPDDYDEENFKKEKNHITSDLTTSVRHTMSFSDIDKEDWDRIFNHDNGCNND